MRKQNNYKEKYYNNIGQSVSNITIVNQKVQYLIYQLY
jgi:hypothetical protein